MYSNNTEQLKERSFAYLDGQMNTNEVAEFEKHLLENQELAIYVMNQKKQLDTLKNQIPSINIDPDVIKRLEQDFSQSFKNLPITEETGWMQKIKSVLSINH
jgi:hypothetical protein